MVELGVWGVVGQGGVVGCWAGREEENGEVESGTLRVSGSNIGGCLGKRRFVFFLLLIADLFYALVWLC
jgi:hypothetical protein